MSTDRNAPPKTGWAKIVTELQVTDLEVSLAFWNDIIGFEIAYRREEEKFVYLEHPEGQQMMLCQRHGRFYTGPMQPPLGQGAMFQIYFRDVGSTLVHRCPKLADLPRSTRSLAQKQAIVSQVSARSLVKTLMAIC